MTSHTPSAPAPTVPTSTDSLGEAFFTLDSAWRFTYLNPASAALLRSHFHMVAEDLLGAELWQRFPAIAGSRFEAALRRSAAGQVPAMAEDFYAPVARWYEMRAYPSHGGLAVFVRDVTLRRAAEERMRKQQSLLTTAQKLAQLGSWEWDVATNHITWSDELCRIYGFAPDDVPRTYQAYLELLHPEDRDFVAGMIEEAYRARRSFEFQHRIVRPDGAVRTLRAHGEMIVEAGSVVRVIGTGQDITDQLESEAIALRLAEEHAARVEAEAGRAQVAAILDSIGELFIALDAGWRITFLNSRADPYLGTLGLSREQLLGRVAWDIFPGARETRFYREALRAAAEQVSVEVEDWYAPLDRWLVARISPTPGGGVVSYIRDITQRRRAEAAVRAGEERFRTLVQSIDDVIYELDREGRIVHVFGRWLEREGLNPEQFIGQSVHQLLGPGATAVHDEANQRALAGERVVYEWALDTLQGRRHLQMSISPLRDGRGEITGAVGVAREITARIRSEQRQRFLAEASAVLGMSLEYETTLESAARLAVGTLADLCMIDLVDDGGDVYRMAVAHRDPAMQPMADRLREYPPLPDSAHPVMEVIRTGRPLVIPEVNDALVARATRGEAHLGISRMLAMRSKMIVPLLARGRTIGAVSLAATVVPRVYGPDDLALAEELALRAALAVDNARLYRAAQAELRQRTEAEAELRRWAHIFEHAAWGIVIVSADGRRLDAMNPAFAEMHQAVVHQLVGRTFDAVVPPEERAAYTQHIREAREQGRYIFESRHQRKEGTLFPVLVDATAVRDPHGAVQYFAVNVQDLTAQKRAEEQVRQGQKMEAVGRLAGGIAHDFNNMLMIIMGFSDFLLASLESEDPRHADADEIRKAAERASALTRQLLAFGRRQLHELEVLDLNTIVRDMELMLRPLLGEDVQLVTTLSTALGGILGDRGQLEQVLMNLALNARDAMSRRGRLTIETMNVTFPEGYAYRTVGIDMPAGPYVLLAVSDSGHGMDAATKSRIFEPFFTTKTGTQNSGLGLATVYGIVSQSEGYIWVDSEPGRGTTFKICFPRVDAVRAAHAAGARDLPRRGSETVLVVEDEDAVRNLAARVLGEQGYAVLQAANGRDALEILARHPDEVSLVLTDVVMPEMGGRDLAEQLARIRPDLRVLYMSGYTDNDIVRRGFDQPGTHFLQKPFSPDSLAHKVREVLDDPLGASGA